MRSFSTKYEEIGRQIQKRDQELNDSKEKLQSIQDDIEQYDTLMDKQKEEVIQNVGTEIQAASNVIEASRAQRRTFMDFLRDLLEIHKEHKEERAAIRAKKALIKDYEAEKKENFKNYEVYTNRANIEKDYIAELFEELQQYSITKSAKINSKEYAKQVKNAHYQPQLQDEHTYMDDKLQSIQESLERHTAKLLQMQIKASESLAQYQESCDKQKAELESFQKENPKEADKLQNVIVQYTDQAVNIEEQNQHQKELLAQEELFKEIGVDADNVRSLRDPQATSPLEETIKKIINEVTNEQKDKRRHREDDAPER